MTWQADLQGALHRNRGYEGVRYVQLATVTPEGLPDVRTVVFRGFDESDVMQFAIDARSDKIQHFAHCAYAAVAWYFPKTREQFRVRGSVALVTPSSVANQDARLALWQKMSDQGRLLWYWPTPKAPRHESLPFLETAPADASPPDTFVVLRLTPQEVDHLRLRGTPQNRDLYWLEGQEWQQQSVNP